MTDEPKNPTMPAEALVDPGPPPARAFVREHLAEYVDERKERMAKRAWLHDREQVLVRRVHFLAILQTQKRAVRGFDNRALGCACCEEVLPLERLYKCFQCELWFCPTCARAHFPEAAAARDADLASLTEKSR